MKNFSLGQIGDYEIKQLRVFKTVVDCGGFSAAETQLNICRPTISIHIANLESRLNLTLCKRGRSGFSLTDEGTVIYDQTCKLLELLESFRNTIHNLSTSPSGQLKIALSDTFSLDPRCRLSEIIKEFCQQAPDVELTTDVEHMGDMERKVLNDELDIAFIPYHRQLEGLNYIHLFTDINYLYCGRDNPLYELSEEQLTEELLHGSRMVHAGLKPHEEVYQQLSSMHLTGTAYHYDSRIAMALSGQYICFLPESVAAPHISSGDLKAIATKSKFFSLGVAVISKKSAQPTRAKDLFLKTINNVFIDAETVAPY
ncbi:LysR family transcriptional regulator [Neptunomonas qingdaonensis]|uniref:DNA-binding transcriptional regulator, LysR family n=1 Tax=Neptunomonas qingdaonensis TaxID=1045558 RepID=A0A1I2N452_9GAMM|nr:LysR family transcriptional regulator [Neptunomonas qingdaonensis]SFF98423.1 DNA-binding transcriptional regulator, LysR family [Neptunomonas qingdaonensis]